MGTKAQELLSFFGFTGEGYDDLANVIAEIANESDSSQVITKDIKSLPFGFGLQDEADEFVIIDIIQFILADIVPKTSKKNFIVSHFHLDTDHIKKKTCGKITVEVETL